MGKMNNNRAGLVLGTFLALFHAIWSIAIAISAESVQSFMDWILNLHRIQMDFSILAFNFESALLLVIMTFISGYIFGYVFAIVFNWLSKK